MANAVVGRVLLMPKGNYSADITYNMLDLVRHDNESWVCKQTCVGQIPQAGDYWQLMASDGAEGGYCYIRYSASADGTGFVAIPSANTDYVGFYTGNSDVAPTDKTEYTWSKFMGEDGKGISSIAKTNTSGLVDTYTITYSDDTNTTFNVTNGKDGNLNYYGTLIMGNSTTPTVYQTGIEYANIGDSYTNTTTFFEYCCVLAGEEVVAKWVYVGSKKGADGLGSGDMLKASYDTNNNGIVDNAEKLGNQLPTYYQQNTNELTEGADIADGDFFPLRDISASADRKTPWSLIKSTLKTYFDTLYNKYVLPIGGSSLGGVKNGGNVTIDEDGEMNAEVGAGNVINITTQETDLFMQTVTATSENGEIATAKFNIVGQATLYAPFTGLITLSASNASGTDEATSRIMSHHFTVFHVELKFNELYGFCVDTTNNSPSDAVTYLAGYDNEFYTPAKMNYVTGVFDYGSWKSAFFLRESRWVMLKSDGTIDYDLDRENHAKKASDGSASDVSNEAYDGNAMFACVNSYIKFWQEEGDLDKLYFAVSKKPLDGFQNYAHHDNDGNTMPYTFIRMFDGTLVSGKLRSLANNATPLNNVTGTAEIGYAQANGDYWYTGLYNDRVLINNLLLLMGKSRDTQTTFGNGHYIGGSSAADYIKTGTMVDKGLFYGTNGTGVGVKVFGIENWWGNIWERIGGYMYASNLQQVKLTYGTEDGSTTTGYNTTGSGYIAIPNSTIGGTGGGYTSAVSFYDKGFVPKTVSGSQSTHWCDGCWFKDNTYALVGGPCATGFLAGAFCVSLGSAVPDAYWTFGASVSCKPLVA